VGVRANYATVIGRRTVGEGVGKEHVMELGLHIANFTWEGGGPALAENLSRTAHAAEEAGFSRVTVMDHFWQIGVIGPPEAEMLEAYTTLGFLAARTERVLLHALVTGVVYRQPGLLAKMVTTLDVLSGGRAGLGIGAAWNDKEARGLGLPFPPLAERFERLEETIQICLQMWSGRDGAYRGAHYELERTLNSPAARSRPHPPLMIGGVGERKTLRLVARYADACNLFGGPETGRKLDVLRTHCEREGRDYDDIEKTATVTASQDGAVDAGPLVEQLRGLSDMGITAAYLMIGGPDPQPAIEEIGKAVIPDVAAW
jgi:F420-dependent oxidoreductase-like protein